MADRANLDANSTLEMLSAEGSEATWALLEELLKEPDLYAGLIAYLEAEFSIRKWQSKFLLKQIAPLIAKGGKWLTGRSGRLLLKRVSRLPGADKVLETLNGALAKFAASRKAQAKFREKLRGHIPAAAQDYAAELPLGHQGNLAILASLEEQGIQLANIWNRLNVQPPLWLDFASDNEETRFLYNATTIPFLGREAEMEEARNFVYSGENFAWWLVSGSGGSGKSRFAFELCLETQAFGLTGFFRRPQFQDGFDWANWQPEFPTLIVIDYVAAMTGQVRQAILTLANRRWRLDFPVRVLLLERDAHENIPWYKELLGTGPERDEIKKSRYAEPLALNPLGDDLNWQIFKAAFKRTGRSLPDRADTLSQFSELDPEKRPLYAAFMADALASGGYARHWDRQRLVLDILERARQKIWPKDVTEPELRLVALATMTGGITRDDAFGDKLARIDWLPGPRNIKSDRYRRISGAMPAERFPPMEPDILGELFVLEILSPNDSLGIESSLAKQQCDLAWEMDRFGMARFLDGAWRDFSDHDLMEVVSRPAIFSRRTRYLWANVAVNQTVRLGLEKNIDAILPIYETIAELATAYPHEPELREQQVRAATDFAVHYGNDGQLDEARALYEVIAAQVTAHPDEKALPQLQALAAYNLTVDYSEEGELDEARALYEELAELATAYPDEPVLRELQARAAFNLTGEYDRRVELNEARALYEVIAALVAAHPDEPALREPQARAAGNLIMDYGDDGQLGRARALYEELAELARTYPDEPALRENQANAATNLTIEYGKAEQLNKTRVLYDAIAELATANPDEPALRAQHAKAATSLTIDYGKAGDLDKTEAFFDVVAELATTHPGEPELRELQARAATSLTIHYGDDGQLNHARVFYDTISALAMARTDEPALWKQLARAATSLTINYGRDGKLNKAGALYEVIVKLATAHSDEPALRELQAKAAFNLIVGYGEAGRLNKARVLYDPIAELAKAYPDEKVLREWQGKIIVVLVMSHKKKGDDAGAKECLASIENDEKLTDIVLRILTSFSNY